MTREEHIKFIEQDTKERDELITSPITFFASIYSCRVRPLKAKSSKKVMYSAATIVMDGCRKITI